MNNLILGATSAIAEALADRWAKQGDNFTLLARNEERLTSLGNHLTASGASDVNTLKFDALQDKLDISALWEQHAVFNLVVIAHGVLDSETVEDLMMINTTSVINVVEQLLELAVIHPISIVILGSVAGDRGRKSNYLYGASKAALATYAAGANHKLSNSESHILLVKPGMIDTPMTHSFEKGPLWSVPERVAADIDAAIIRRKHEIYTPRFWSMIMLIIRLLPRFVFHRTNL